MVDLQVAKEKERRLIDLGNTVAEFGHDIRNANGSIYGEASGGSGDVYLYVNADSLIAPNTFSLQLFFIKS